MNLLDFLIKRPPAGMIQDPNQVWKGPTSIAPSAGKVKGAGLLERLLPTPEGTDGLLSDSDMKSARNQGLLGLGASLLESSGPSTQPQGLGAALGKALTAGRGGFDSAVGNNLKMISNRQELQGGQMKLDTAKQGQAARQAVFSKFPPPKDGSDPAAMSAWLNQVIPALVAGGATADAEQLATVKKAIEKNQYQQTQAGNMATVFDPQTGKFWDPAANSGKGDWVKSVERGLPADQIELKKAQLAAQQARTEATMTLAEARGNRVLHSGFMARNKAVADRAAILNQSLITLHDAEHDPALYSSAIVNFIQAADQKAQVRIEMLKFFKANVDPSIGGKWEVLKSRILEGKLPGYASGSMIRHLEKLKKLSQEEWTRRRAGEIKRHPDLEGYIPPADELYESDLVPDSATANPNDPTAGYPGLR